MADWIDPLRLAIEAPPARPGDSLLLLVRQNFGSEYHYQLLRNALQRSAPNDARFIDLTPFSRVGNSGAFQQHLIEEGHLDQRTHLVVSSPQLASDLLAIDPILQLRLFPPLADLPNPATSSPLETLEDNLRSVYCSLRRQQRGVAILPTVLSATLDASSPDWTGEKRDLDGRSYLRMANGMLVTHFVHMKRLLSSREMVEALAYEIAAQACLGFAPSLDHRWPDMFVASSDHSFLIGAQVQRLTGRPCGVIDRIGLLPGRRLTKDTVSLDVAGHRVCVIVDLSATGAEMERAVTLLVQRGARVQTIVCCVWLGCAIPRFVDSFQFVPICEAKQSLDYIYRSNPD